MVRKSNATTSPHNYIHDIVSIWESTNRDLTREMPREHATHLLEPIPHVLGLAEEQTKYLDNIDQVCEDNRFTVLF